MYNMMRKLDCVEILNKTNKEHYKDNFEKVGYIKRVYKNKYGVYFENNPNPLSDAGLFWYDKCDLKSVGTHKEEKEMTGYKYVAIVNMLNGTSTIDYAFALFDSEKKLLTMEESLELIYPNPLIVVNANHKDKRQLAIIKEIKTLDEFKKTSSRSITSQVVGVVNMDGYIAREDAEKKAAELEAKKKSLMKEIKTRTDKLKDLQYFEYLADRFADFDPGLKDLVSELKALDGINFDLNKSNEDSTEPAADK